MSDVQQPAHKFVPYLCIRNAGKAIDYYVDVFGAKETMPRIQDPDGKIGHAEIDVLGQLIMIADEHPDYGAFSPQMIGGTHVQLMLYVDDPAAWIERAKAAGAKEMRPLTDHFYGDRSDTIEDPFGYVWIFAKRIEEVSGDEILARAQKLYGSL